MIQVEILYVLIGLIIGIFIVYITTSNPKIILKYPTLDNYRNTTYVDENGQCYKYDAISIDCKNKKNQVKL